MNNQHWLLKIFKIVDIYLHLIYDKTRNVTGTTCFLFEYFNR